MSRFQLSASCVLLALVWVSPAWPQPSTPRNPARPRTIVTADPELDDSNSLVRFLLYTTDVQTEGLIYASSRFHWKGDGKPGQTIHLLLQVTDDGTPALTYFQRVIVTVGKKAN